MSKQLVIVKAGAGEMLQVLGAGVRFLCTPDKTEKAWSLMEVSVARNAGPPPHHHPWDEAYYITHGKVKFSIEGREQVFQEGDFVYAPAGVVHGFQGDSDETSRLLIFDSPGHAESFFRDVDREIHSPADLPKIPQIGERNRIYFQQR